MALAFSALFALFLFLLGKYSPSLARLEGQRLLRPGAGYLMLGAFMSGLAATSEAAVLCDFPKVDVYVAYGLCVVLALTAVETPVGPVPAVLTPRPNGPARAFSYTS